MSKPVSCQGCPYYHLPFVGRVKNGIIMGDGPQDANVMLIGEAPWKEEQLEGAYFVGKAGSLLNIALAEAGLSRRACYVTNTVKCVTLSPSSEAIEHCKQAHLLEEIKIVQPNVVVAIGGVALEALTGHERITKWRGHLLEVKA